MATDPRSMAPAASWPLIATTAAKMESPQASRKVATQKSAPFCPVLLTTDSTFSESTPVSESKTSLVTLSHTMTRTEARASDAKVNGRT